MGLEEKRLRKGRKEKRGKEKEKRKGEMRRRDGRKEGEGGRRGNFFDLAILVKHLTIRLIPGVDCSYSLNLQ